MKIALISLFRTCLPSEALHNLSTGGKASGCGTAGPAVGRHVLLAVGLFAAPCQLGSSENVVGSQLEVEASIGGCKNINETEAGF